MTDHPNIPLETLLRRKIDVWHFLEDIYGHDQTRHHFADSTMALDWYTRHEDPKTFFKKVAKYLEDWE